MSSPGTAPAKTADSSHSERALYSKIYANAPESVFLINPSGGHILFANPKAQEDTSYELSELEGLDFRRLFFPEDKEAIEALLQATQQWNNGSDPIRILRRKSGKKIFVEISTLLVDFGGKPTIAASVRDITARVKAEHKVREYSRELEKINAELEDRVKARTAELAKANEMLQATNALITARKKELDDVMNNIQQAILTIAPSGRINPEFSRFALDVFGERTISGADLVEFLFPPEERTSRGESLKGWLKTVYEQPELWEMVKDFGVRELSYLRPNADGTFERRDLQFEWRPVYENDQIAKMMLVGWDITEQKRLQAEIEKKEAAHREELELISQLIHQPREVVEQFVSDFDRNLREGLENLGQGPDSLGPEQIKALLRALHTIKGSAKQFGLQSIQRQAHDLEGRLTGAGEKGAGPALYAQIREDFEALEKSLGGILEIYAKVTQGSAGKGSAGGAFPAGPVFPVPVDKLDSLIRRVFTHEGPVPAPAVRRALAWLFHEPVSNLFDRLETLARKLAPELGKEIEVEREGDSIQLDHRLLVLLHDAFAHAVRNSLDHGAEGPDDRKLAGKPPAALLRFRARKLDGNRVEIEIEDDGRGIDVERVRMKAVEKGLVNPYAAQQASAADAMAFIFLPGFSTRDTASEVSGRGVGLDVLKETVANRLHGRVYVQSTPGKGTRVGARFDAERPDREAP